MATKEQPGDGPLTRGEALGKALEIHQRGLGSQVIAFGMNGLSLSLNLNTQGSITGVTYYQDGVPVETPILLGDNALFQEPGSNN